MREEYAITGGQLIIDKKVFAREMLLSQSFLKRIILSSKTTVTRQPAITKTQDFVIVDYNNASPIPIDANNDDLFQHLKGKYREKFKGRITIRISFLSTFFMVLDFNQEDDKVIREY